MDTSAQGFSSAQARPLAAETPMRTPVNDPGPAATAMTSASSSLAPQRWSICSSMGMRVTLWVRPLFWKAEAMSRSSSHSATEQAVADVSRAMIFILLPPPES